MRKRKLTTNTEVRNYAGTSKGMEGEGTMRICKLMKSGGYIMVGVSHDNDASCMANVKEYFPNVVEHLDIGHAAKNLCQKVRDAAHGCDELYGYGDRVKRWFQKAARECGGDSTKFANLLKHSVNHWSGDHSKCGHTTIPTPTYKPLTPNGIGAKLLQSVLDPYITNAAKYCGAHSSNVCEAINNKITVYAPKRLNFAKSYGWRASLAMLVHNEGLQVKSIILDKLSLLLSPNTNIELQHAEVQQTKDKKRKDKQQTKEARLANKAEKKKRGKRGANAAHTYKGGCLPDDECVVDEDRTTSEKPAKKSRADSGKCGCGSAAPCSNNRCTCVAFGRGCSAKCKCGDACKNNKQQLK